MSRWGVVVCCFLGLLVGFSAVGSETPASAEAPPGSIRFVGKNRIATAKGLFHRWRVVEQSIDPDRIASARIVIEVDLGSVDTGNRQRDDHLRTADFFDVSRWPTARVVVDGFEATASADEGRPAWTARFAIDLHGVERVLSGTVTRVAIAPVVFEGELLLDRTEFGIGAPPSRWSPMSIDAGVPVRFRYVMEEKP